MPEKFIVPQFIDKEDQILGPITVRQFLILLVTTFCIFIFYKLLAFPYFVGSALLLAIFSGTFAFMKINGQPFHVFFVNFLQTSIRPQLRIWDKRPTDAELRVWIASAQVASVPHVTAVKPRPDSSRLRDLSLIVNTGGVYRPDEELL
ncbi:MAG: PrgI family protein [Patescibacteria group bacterium]